MTIRPVIGSDNFVPSEEDTEEETARVSSPTYITPNPGNGLFTFNDLVETITIYNTNGFELYTKEINADNLDLSFLDQGLYLVKLQSGNNIHTTRLLIN